MSNPILDLQDLAAEEAPNQTEAPVSLLSWFFCAKPWPNL